VAQPPLWAAWGWLATPILAKRVAESPLRPIFWVAEPPLWPLWVKVGTGWGGAIFCPFFPLLTALRVVYFEPVNHIV
jgi:hypothetical protein